MIVDIKQAVKQIRSDPFLCVPAAIVTLLLSLVSPFFVAKSDVISLLDMGFFFMSNLFQSFIMVAIVFMIQQKRGGQIRLDLLFEWLRRYKRYVLMCVTIATLPLCFFAGFGFYTMGLPETLPKTLLLVFLIFFCYMLVHMLAFSYLICVFFVSKPTAIVSLVPRAMRLCFSYSRQCIRWFVMVFCIHAVHWLMLPFIMSSFFLNQVCNAIIQSLVITLTVAFSFYYFKRVFRAHL